MPPLLRGLFAGGASGLSDGDKLAASVFRIGTYFDEALCFQARKRVGHGAAGDLKGAGQSPWRRLIVHSNKPVQDRELGLVQPMWERTLHPIAAELADDAHFVEELEGSAVVGGWMV